MREVDEAVGTAVLVPKVTESKPCMHPPGPAFLQLAVISTST